MFLNRRALLIAVLVGVVVHTALLLATGPVTSSATDALDEDMLFLLLRQMLFAGYGLLYCWLADRGGASAMGGDYAYGGGATGLLVALISWLVMTALSMGNPVVEQYPGAYLISVILG